MFISLTASVFYPEDCRMPNVVRKTTQRMCLVDEPNEYWLQRVRYELFIQHPFSRLPQYDQRGSRSLRAEKLSNQCHIDTDFRTVLCRGSALVMEIQSAFFVRLKASRRVRIGTALGCAGVRDRRSMTDRLNAATTKGVKGHTYRTEVNTIKNKTRNVRVMYHSGAFA